MNWRERPHAKTVNCEDRESNSRESSTSAEVYHNFSFVAESKINISEISSDSIKILNDVTSDDFSDLVFESEKSSNPIISTETNCSLVISENSNSFEAGVTESSCINLAAAAKVNESKDHRFLIDSGADNHLINDNRFLTEIKPVENLKYSMCT